MKMLWERAASRRLRAANPKKSRSLSWPANTIGTCNSRGLSEAYRRGKGPQAAYGGEAAPARGRGCGPLDQRCVGARGMGALCRADARHSSSCRAVAGLVPGSRAAHEPRERCVRPAAEFSDKPSAGKCTGQPQGRKEESGGEQAERCGHWKESEPAVHLVPLLGTGRACCSGRLPPWERICN